MVKIKKSDISHPSPLYVPSSLGHPASSGSLQSLITPGASSSSSSLCPSPDLTAHQQYYQNPLDASASTTSLVRHELQAQTRPVLTTHKFQSLVQGVQGLQRQLSALAQASQAFVRELDDVLVCIDPNSTEYSDLSILTESTQLLSNTHESWSSHLEQDIEYPLVQMLHSVLSAAEVTKINNKKKMEVLGQMLQREEELSYKMGKKMKGRDMGALQSSLQKRIKISNEINRLQNDTRTCGDALLQDHVSEIVSLCTRCTALEVEASEQLGEGLVKIGADAFTVQGGPMSDGIGNAEPPILDREFVQLAIKESERGRS